MNLMVLNRNLVHNLQLLINSGIMTNFFQCTRSVFGITWCEIQLNHDVNLIIKCKYEHNVWLLLNNYLWCTLDEYLGGWKGGG